MGTTLTGTTPQDTYDSLIKVTDNGPLSGSLKKLTDGLGNDSALSLSTGAASITGTLASTAGANFATSSGNVGIGTGSPSYKLDTRGIAAVFNAGIDGVTAPTLYLGHPSYTTTYLNKISTSVSAAAGGQVMQFSVANGASTYADVMTLNGAGNVGIGTSNPAQNLSVEENTLNPSLVSLTGSFGTSRGAVISLAADELGANEAALKFTTSIANPYGGYVFSTQGGEKLRILSTGGITFNGDTAAANALDDYEEGTWTMGVSFGGGTTGITYNGNTGKYTKIGRQVTATGYLALTSKGSSTGSAQITGLPFALASGDSSFSPATVWFIRVSFANQFEAYGQTGATHIVLGELTEAGTFTTLADSDFQNNTEIMVSITYFV